MKRIFFNPDKNKLSIFEASHVEYFHNHKKELNNNFDSCIRGIIADNALYLRLYYPYNDINEKSFIDIKQASFSLLKASETDILKGLKAESIIIKEVFLNVSNQDIKDKFNLLYV